MKRGALWRPWRERKALLLSHFADFIHEFLHALFIHQVFKLAVYLEGRGDNCAVGHGELALDVVFAGSGVAEHNRIRNRILHLGENLGVGLGAGGQAGNAEGVGLVVEYRRLGDLADIPVRQIFGGFGNML